MKKTKREAWDKSQCRAFVKAAKDRWGDGWDLLSIEQRDAFLMREVTTILQCLDEGSKVTLEDICTLIQDVRRIGKTIHSEVTP